MARTSTRLPAFRQRLPLDLVEAAKGKRFTFMLPYAQGDETIVVVAKAGDAIAFSLRTDDRHLVLRRQAAALEQFQAHMENLRGGEVDLSPRMRVALAGVIYKEFTTALADDGVLTAEEWRAVSAEVGADATGGPIGRKQPEAQPSRI